MSSFQDMTQAVTCRFSDKIKKACTPLFEYFNINYFWHYYITDSGHYSYMGTHVAWSEYFAAEKLYLHYPYFRHPKYFQEGASAMESIEDESLTRILNSARTKFDTHQQNLLLTRKTSDRVELYGFAFNGLHPAAIFSELQLLRLFLKKFREENSFLFSCLEDHQIDLANLVGPAFYQKSAVFESQFAREEFFKELGIKNPLSASETRVVKLLLKGYSASQIGKKIFLSKRTVEHHLERVKDKLGCKSRAELIQKARELEDLCLLT